MNGDPQARSQFPFLLITGTPQKKLRLPCSDVGFQAHPVIHEIVIHCGKNYLPDSSHESGERTSRDSKEFHVYGATLIVLMSMALLGTCFCWQTTKSIGPSEFFSISEVFDVMRAEDASSLMLIVLTASVSVCLILVYTENRRTAIIKQKDT